MEEDKIVSADVEELESKVEIEDSTVEDSIIDENDAADEIETNQV